MINKLLYSIQSVINLTMEEKDGIKKLFTESSLRKGDFFVEEGKISRHVGFLAKGLVRYYINHEGDHKTYEFAQENNFIGNYESFLSKTPSTKIIQALEDCEIFYITYENLQLFYKSVQQGERFGRIVIESVFLQTLQALSSIYTDTPEVRYEQFIKRHPDLQQRISQYHIASYVGVKPQSLSRIRKRILSSD